MLRANLHDRLVHARRVHVLRDHVVSLLPTGASVLDVGCGDGFLTSLIAQQRPDLHITGMDVLVRQAAHIHVIPFGGSRIPLEADACDVVTLIDVLHHTEEPRALLEEAARVARHCVVLKDHCSDSLLTRPLLRFMDWMGNAHQGVALPYNYLSTREWHSTFESLGLEIGHWRQDLGLYAPPAGWIFDRKLHFVASLRSTAGERQDSEAHAAAS